MKLHLPVLLRKALLACFAFAFACSESVFAADFTLGSEDSLTIDYADAESIPDLENGTLQLNGDTILLLSNCGSGDGKTYTLLNGVEGLRDADGSPLTLTEENNVASLYFDATQPGTGFWANGWLQLAEDGSVQLVLHDTEVLEALTITTRQTGSLTYNYYEGITFQDITYTASGSSSATGGAIYGDSITLSNNGSVTFSGNVAGGGEASGGAIYGADYCTITLNKNGRVMFSENSASGTISSYGGAIYGSSYITLNENGSVTFSGNAASSGGAIYGGTILLNNNSSVEFCDNSSGYRGFDSRRGKGGAIYGDMISICTNGNLRFCRNSVIWDGALMDVILPREPIAESPAYGGAIYGRNVILRGNGCMLFSGNAAHGDAGGSGGAIYSEGELIIENNALGTTQDGKQEQIIFEDNDAIFHMGTVSYGGGAIFANGTLKINNNGEIIFRNNESSLEGSAIYVSGDVFFMQNNKNRALRQKSRVNDGEVSCLSLSRR